MGTCVNPAPQDISINKFSKRGDLSTVFLASTHVGEFGYYQQTKYSNKYEGFVQTVDLVYIGRFNGTMWIVFTAAIV